MQINKSNLDNELKFSSSRSSGPGGQHVNKTETRVELRFNIPASEVLSEKEKSTLLDKLKNKITKDGELIITSQEHKSQSKNKEECIEKFYELITRALKPRKTRKKTRPSKAAREKRLKEKKIQSEKKEQRKPPEV